MFMLNESKPKFAIRQVAQGASYFNILEDQGLAKDFSNMKKSKG